MPTRDDIRLGLKPLKRNEFRFAIAVVTDLEPRLNLWIRKSPRGDFFVFQPRRWDDQNSNVHATYHHDGTFHLKADDQPVFSDQHRQELGRGFRGAEHLGAFYGHGRTGLSCPRDDFTVVITVGPEVVGPDRGGVLVDLVEPGQSPTPFPWPAKETRTFQETEPWVVVRLGVYPE